MTVGIWCSLCRDHHPEGKPVHRLPIQRLLAKQAALEEQIRRMQREYEMLMQSHRSILKMERQKAEEKRDA